MFLPSYLIFAQAPFSKALYLDPPEQIFSIATKDSIHYLNILNAPPPEFNYVQKMAATDLEGEIILESVLSNNNFISASSNHGMVIKNASLYFVGNIAEEPGGDVDGFIVEQNFTGSGLFKSEQQPAGGGFAAAALSHQTENFPCFNAKIYAVQSQNRILVSGKQLFSGKIGLAHPFHLNQGIFFWISFSHGRL